MADASNPYQQAISVALNDAKSMLGKNEVPNRSEIQQYLRDGGQDLDPHKLAWCAAFVSASLQKAGLPVPTQVVKDSAFGPGAYAPNYLSYGSAVEPGNIRAGDILIANNGRHVGFAEGPIRQGAAGPEVQLLAGNEIDISGRYAPGSYTNPQTGAVAKRSQVGMVGERWVPLSQYSARRYEPTDNQNSPSAAQGTTLNTTPGQQAPASSSDVIDALGRNIAQIESGTFKNPYEAVNPTTHATGKYQVLPNNIPGWTLMATGKSMTPDEFRASPDAQEAVFRDQMQRNLQLYSPKDAASIWFTGKPYNIAGGNVKDAVGTTNADYVTRATAGIENADVAGGSTVAKPAAPTTPAAGALAGGGGNILPGFSDAKTSDKFKKDVESFGQAMGYGGQGDETPRPPPMGPAPVARNVSPLGGAMLPMSQALQSAITGYQPQPYGHTLTSLADPLQWGSAPPGQAPYGGTGQQAPQAEASPYGTSLAGLQMAYGLSPQQLQMLMSPMMLSQGTQGGSYG